jgi:sensor histidine kinase YesM
MAISSALASEPVGPPIASTVGPILLATLLARWRRSLLRPEAPLVRTMVVHLGVGVGYAVTSAFISAAVVDLIVQPGNTFWNASPSVIIAYLSVLHLILYVVLAEFLMWTESIRQVQETHAKLAHEAVLRAQAEVKALRAQFNPHFVLNTLHSLMILVREEPEAAEKAIEDVGALIRYASRLEKCDRDTVPLPKEIEIAERYLALESLRLATRLAVSWEISSDPELYYVPSFSLQSLLENAIKHGLFPKPAGGKVRIGIGVEDRHLAVSVQDDGMGADPKDVLDGDGRGLGLLERRLSALYGPGASLTWDTARGRGFSVLLKIPLASALDETLGYTAASPADAVRSPSERESLP